MRRTSWILLAVLLLSLVLSACTAVAPAGDAAGPQTYTLGIALPYTGSLGSFGTYFQKGVELAVEQMNAQLEAAGASVRFQTASADTEGTPDGALKACLLYTSRVFAKGHNVGAEDRADEAAHPAQHLSLIHI